MPINVKISLCKITKASRLFQRNYYLPLLKPLSPKDALRRKIITGQNVLGLRYEHYIPVLQSYDDQMHYRRRRPKGKPVIKKRVRMRDNLKYVQPFFDDDMENHALLQGVLRRKGKGNGQLYVYEVLDKNCGIVINFQMEKALKDKEIVDIMVAQRSEKIFIKLNNELKITLPVASFNGGAPLYKGSGWTKEVIEEDHHHGKETFSVAKIFEAKESGVAEWELEMMRLANKRRKKVKGEELLDWKQMMAGCLENMDWDKFEEETRQIVEEVNEPLNEEIISMAVDDMEKTKNVNEKLKSGGVDILSQLPSMLDVPEVIKILETGELCELQNVSGVRVKMSTGRMCFVTGQMVKSDENEVFIPGQTVENESGAFEYTPGITVYVNDEPTLIPGLVTGEEETPAIFLPGESTITNEGQLQFQSTEQDKNPQAYYIDELSPEEEEPQTESESESESEPEPEPEPELEVKPKPRPIKEEVIVIKRRVFTEDPKPILKEKVKKRLPVESMVLKKKKEKKAQEGAFKPQRQPRVDPLVVYQERLKQMEEEEKKRMKARMESKIREQEQRVDTLRFQIRKKYKSMVFEKPAAYQPQEPVKKSSKLAEFEESISKGTFFDDEQTKKILENARSSTRKFKLMNALSAYDFGSSGIGRMH